MKHFFNIVILVFIPVCVFAQQVKKLEIKTLVAGLSQATAIYAAPTGHIYITEARKNRILVINPQGQRIDSVGNTGTGNYQFDTPTDVDATNGLKIYVADYNNYRIQVYDRYFQYLTTIQKSDNFGNAGQYEPAKLCVNNRGELFFFDDNSGTIIKYNSIGEYDQKFRALSDLITNSPSFMMSLKDRIYIGDPIKGVIHIITNNGRYIGFLGGMKQIAGMAAGNHYLWAYTPDELHVITQNGQLVKKFKLSKQTEATGIAIYGENIYLLTPDKIFYLRIPFV